LGVGWGGNMGFLLAKIVLLLAAAAACGALFTWWWFRRHYEDVTLEHTRAREEWQAWRLGFEERLAQRPQVDLEPLLVRLAALEAVVQRIDLPTLAPTEKRLTAIEHALFPVQTRLDALESAVRALHVPPAQTTDLTPVLEGLEALRSRLESPPPPQVAVREGTRNLLTYAGHGKPDDLTRIKGLPKVLERTLHDVGVFYFWQIAEWSAEDVQQVDSQLTAYKGRIERDDWVRQATELAASSTAAHRPGH
jgi:predicted flap endonuclease-1-like 5' DNA nuclease